MQMEVTQAEADVINERRAHVRREGWSDSSDDGYANGELARGAAAYAMSAASHGANQLHDMIRHVWPWSPSWWKPTSNRRDLVKAGSLIIAEIERIDRQARVSTRQADMSKQST